MDDGSGEGKFLRDRPPTTATYLKPPGDSRDNPVLVSDSESEGEDRPRPKRAQRLQDEGGAAVPPPADSRETLRVGMSALLEAGTEKVREFLLLNNSEDTLNKLVQFASLERNAVPNQCAKVRLLMKRGASLDEGEPTVLDLVDPVRTADDTLNLMLTKGNLGEEAIKRLNDVSEAQIELQVALRDMDPRAIERLFTPSCRSERFLEELAAAYMPRLRELETHKKTGCVDKRSIDGAMIWRLQGGPPKSGRLAVFTATLTTPVAVDVKGIDRAAWYNWLPFVMANAFTYARPSANVQVGPELTEADFVRASSYTAYKTAMRHPVTLSNETFDDTGDSFVPDWTGPRGKFEEISDATYYASGAYKVGRTTATFFRKGTSHKVFLVVVIADASLYDWMAAPPPGSPLTAINMGVSLIRSNDRKRQSHHAMILDVGRNGAYRTLTPFDSNHRGLQGLASAEPAARVYSGGFCQTWTPFSLELRYLGAIDWVASLVRTYSEHSRPKDRVIRETLERLFGGDKTPKSPLTHFVLCIVLRYRDAQKLALYTLQVRTYFKSVQDLGGSVPARSFYDWLGREPESDVEHNLYERALSAETKRRQVQKWHRELKYGDGSLIGDFFESSNLEPNTMSTGLFDAYLWAYTSVTGRDPTVAMFDDGSRFINASRLIPGTRRDITSANFNIVRFNMRAVGPEQRENAAGEAARTNNMQVVHALVTKYPALAAHALARAEQSGASASEALKAFLREDIADNTPLRRP
tara:strand:+ start:3692 stop:5950 length:2259 start_codon:yes stop_codon:yes gene_type:complete